MNRLPYARPSTRRPFTALVLGLFLPFAGCSSDPNTDRGDDEVNGDGSPLGSMHIKADSFSVPPGGDVTRCTPVRGTNDTAMFTNRFRSKQKGHHQLLYVVDHAIAGGSFVCPQGGQWNWSQIYSSQRNDEQYRLPEGVGYKLGPHQQFVVETHIINTSDEPIEATSEIDLDFIDEAEVKFTASAFFIGTTNIAIPPRAEGRSEAKCTMPADLHIARFFGHTHRYGTDLKVSHVKDGAVEAPFYSMGAWDDATVLDSLELKSGDALHVGCDYQNPEDRKLGYPDEMCIAGGLYWPANGTLICESYGNDPTCKCYQPVNTNLGSGGQTVTIEVTRDSTIPGTTGDLAEGRPVYCYLYRKQDIEESGPLNAKLAYWAVTDQGTPPLASEGDKVELTMQDVTPGEYYATCAMDTVYGGYFPGTGAPIVFPYAPVMVGTNGTTKVQINLNMPMP